MTTQVFDNALSAYTVLIIAIEALDDSGQRETALKLIEEWYARGKNSTVEETTVRSAHEVILRLPVVAPKFEPAKKPSDRRMFETIAKAWTTWAMGADPRTLLQSIPKPSEYGGAIHMMALEPWGAAIKALFEKDADEALRLFRRSMELGSQCETETNDVVQWTYVASFFHRGT